MYSTRDFTPALASGTDSKAGTFDFAPQLADGVTIESVIGITAVVHPGGGGPDANPQSIINGSYTIVPSPSTGNPAQGVVQQIGPNSTVVGACVYTLSCKVTGTDGFPYSLETRVTFYVPS
jgi:hypothetical protein